MDGQNTASMNDSSFMTATALARKIEKMDDDLSALATQDLSMSLTDEKALLNAIQKELEENQNSSDKIKLRRLKCKLRLREIERNQGRIPFNLDKRTIETLMPTDFNRNLREFHSKRAIFNFINSIGDITSSPIEQIPKKIRKIKDKIKKDPNDQLTDTHPPNKEQSDVLNSNQPESVKLKKNGCVTSAEMETHLQRTLSKSNQSLQSQYFNEYKDHNRTFEESLFGDIHGRKNKTPIKSAWSGKVLKPFILRDSETLTQRMKLHEDIISFVSKKNHEPFQFERKSIDYCYLRPEMVGSVNSLLFDNFWPEIDISESLIYPEHTVVVLYGKIVIGCGFITPAGYITYLCVHNEWQNAGIGKFMLYHLIQTCPGKDITLHVSVNNPALILYQMFSFKIEEFIKNFYDKYLPENSVRCKHAFFLRLRK